MQAANTLTTAQQEGLMLNLEATGWQEGFCNVNKCETSVVAGCHTNQNINPEDQWLGGN